MAHIASPGLDMLSRDSARLDLIGQLKPGRTLEEARAEMRGLASQLEAAHAESRDSAGLSVSSLTAFIRRLGQVPRGLPSCSPQPSPACS